jgi:hypothetical protein
MTMPNFLIIGAMKSGTTALYYYLEQHHQIYMSPVKEPNFFCHEGQESVGSTSVTDIGSYQALFKGVSGERAIGEASNCYLYEPKAAGRIRSYIPDVKLITILRNPIERAYSHFMHAVRSGTEPFTDFAQALREEETGSYQKRDFRDYVGKGLYHGQLERYFDTFDRGQVKVYLYEDLSTAPIDTLRDAFGFLEVDDSFVPDVSVRRNVSGYPKHKSLDSFLRRPSSVKNALKKYMPAKARRHLSEAFDILKARNLDEPPPMQPEVRRQLIKTYRQDILRLQKLVCRDLSGWLE